MTIDKQLGMRIRYLRRQKGMSILELSIESDVNKNYLSDLERGVRNPSVNVLNKIAKTLGVSLSELFRGIEEIH